MTPIQTKRQHMALFLLGLAVVAGVVRHFSEPGTTLRYLSTVLMLLWLPVIGSIVGWCYGKLQRPPPPPPKTFAPGQAFAPHVLVEFTLRPPSIPAEDIPVPPGEHRFVLVVDNQGFQTRWQMPGDDIFRRGETRTLPVELLTPHKAMPHLPVDASFRMLVGDAFIGDGRVVQWLIPAEPSTASAA
jgi:hypothetical protein